MTDVKKLSVSDLLLLSRPVTGALSLSVSPSNPSDSSQNAGPSTGGARKRTRNDENQERDLSERSPRILEPLDHPTILIGSVDLWADVSDQWSGCSKNDCMLFADEGGRVCCDILELDIGMIGRRVTVLAWNFIPSKCSAGLLEIIKWKLAEPPTFRSLSGDGCFEDGFYPLCPSSDSLQSEVLSFSGSRRIGRCELTGQLTSVSPIFDVPCTAKSGPPDVSSESRPEILIGFLVEFLVCDCSECSSVMYPNHIYGNDVNPVMVYFCGAAAKWRPVFAKLVGSFIHLMGLKRKLVLVDVEPIHMLVSTSKTGMRFYRKEHEVSSEGALTRKRTPVNTEFTGQYTGVVTGVYMQGMVVELDEKVWLVFTDQLRNPHSLRVGAIVAVRNAHFILPKFSWSNMLLLGACVKTVLIIKRFSALATQCHFRSRTNSLLAKFVGSLSFIAKFWMLLMVSSFREKFSGILLEKEILGSKSKEGLAQIYAKTCFSSHSSQLRHGIFKEFCKHNCCCCGDDPEIGATKLALPISYIFSDAESMWMRSLRYVQKHAKNIETNKDDASFPHERILHNRFSRHVISSRDLGMVLLGMLQVSPSSGKLQLIDATGRIDAVVPDFRLHTNDLILYKVDNFKLIMEGNIFDGSGVDQSKSALCKNIFQHVAMQRKLPLRIYVHFYLKTATYIDSHMQLSASNHEHDISNGHFWGRFHLLFVTHKFPADYNVHADKKISNTSRLYAEAILTPFILLFLRESNDSPIFGKDKILDKCLKYNHPHGQLDERWLNKEGNFEVARAPFSSEVNDDVDHSGLDLYDMNLDTCPNFFFCRQHDNVLGQQQVKTEDFEFPLDVSCSLISNNYSKCYSHFRGSVSNWNRNGDSEKSGGEVVLLEFNSGSFEKFQVLHIGAYYIIRCDQDTSGCQLDHIKDSCSAKVLVTPQTQFWSLSFSSCPYHCKKPFFAFYGSVNDPLTNGSLIMNEVPLRYFTKNRLIHDKFRSHLLNHGFFNLDLHLSFNKLKFLRQVLRATEALKRDESYRFREAHKYNGGVLTASTSYLSKKECLLHRGNFVSVCGEIVDVHCLNDYPIASKAYQVFGSGNKSGLSYLLQGQNGICIHVNEGHRTVKIRGTLDVHACPSGMGPGTIATFYRILSSSSSEDHVMVLTPATFIVVNMIKEVHYHDGGKFLTSRIKDDVTLPCWSKTSSSLMFKSFHCFQSSPIQLRGQVVSVSVLVLEKCLHKYKSCSWRSKRIPSVSIPLAGFIFDDGSLSCCCWAATVNAAALLKLNKSASEVFVAKSNRKLCENRRPLCTVGDTLGKMIKKHRQIIIRNTCAAVSDDLSCVEFSYSSCLNKTLSTSDQDLIKFIIINACSGPIMCVIGSVMGSDKVELIQSYMDMPTKVYPPHNFWVEEVSHVDALAEARDILHELTW